MPHGQRVIAGASAMFFFFFFLFFFFFFFCFVCNITESLILDRHLRYFTHKLADTKEVQCELFSFFGDL